MKTIVFDFDGVIHDYKEGYKDGTIYGEANYMVLDLMKQTMRAGVKVAIVSTRSAEQIHEWFCSDKVNAPFKTELVPIDQPFWNKIGIVGITNRKLGAIAYVDDRGVRFEGDTDKLKSDLENIMRGE